MGHRSGSDQPNGLSPRHSDGTVVFLVSDNLTGDQLAMIAAGLRPAPSAGNV
jgi:hypothetical protein